MIYIILHALNKTNVLYNVYLQYILLDKGKHERQLSRVEIAWTLKGRRGHRQREDS